MKRLLMIGVAIALLALNNDTAGANILVRIDVQQVNNNNGVLTTDEPSATTQSSSFGSDGTDHWNAVEKAVGALPTQFLKASNAPFGPTVALFDVFGLNFTAGRQASADPLQHDYFQATNANPVTWQISGLAPNASYELVLYGGQDTYGSGSVADTRFGLDLDGDTVLETSIDVSHTNAAVYFPSMLTDSAGVLRGSFAQVPGNDPGTGSWSGLQISGPVGIPEPASAAILCLGTVFLLIQRRSSACCPIS